MPAALDLQQDLDGSARLLFVAPASTLEEVHAAVEERGWIAGGAMWTSEAPLTPTSRYPAFALLSSEGEVLLEGSAQGREPEIRAELERLT